MTLIRKATPQDSAAVCRIDAMILGNTSRSTELCTAIAAGQCYVASFDMDVIGFAIMNQSFFNQSFVSLIMVHPQYQKHGVGADLLLYLESICPTDKLFTSTNLSNKRMQRLCNKLGYDYSGTITHLDQADPELFYCKTV
ncbi:GNAT family N-acetyltransferase [Brevibacillus reuszeri]|uniref:GNAT family N-acetyltransferase n=1 Tax=Brevibacillus reuszeri TaxID=54915 RepID=UPI0028A0D91D|nr:GNAT family N-acetyltransferase [Brevibacillus reuszeri]